MRPFFPFYGSKWNIARRYPSPQHDTVIEPFAGSAGYATFYDCRRVILVDSDPIIAGLWKYLIQADAATIGRLPELPEPGECVDDHDLCDEEKWLIGFWLNRGSASPKKTRTAFSARSDRSQLNWGRRAKDRIIGQLELIRDWQVTEGSYESSPDIEATWFIDPPYQEKGKYYRVRFGDHEELAWWSLGRRGAVIACEGQSASWLPFRELGNYKTSRGKARELVYMQGIT